MAVSSVLGAPVYELRIGGDLSMAAFRMMGSKCEQTRSTIDKNLVHILLRNLTIAGWFPIISLLMDRIIRGRYTYQTLLSV